MKTKSLIYVLALSILSILSLANVSAQTNTCPMGGYSGMMSGSYGTGGLFFGWITSILVIILILAAIYWLIKSATRKR